MHNDINYNILASKNSERMRVIELKTINEQKLDAIEKKVKKQMLSTIEEEEETSL